MLQWMRELTPGERRTMAGCFGGWSLDALDVQIYSFVIPTLLATWNISRGEAGLLGTVTLVVSSFGGWFAGALSDRYGRVRVLQITVLWYAVFTFLCGFAQNFEQLFVLRAMQGLGFGAEWSAGAVLMGEIIRDNRCLAPYGIEAIDLPRQLCLCGMTLVRPVYAVTWIREPDRAIGCDDHIIW